MLDKIICDWLRAFHSRGLEGNGKHFELTSLTCSAAPKASIISLLQELRWVHCDSAGRASLDMLPHYPQSKTDKVQKQSCVINGQVTTVQPQHEVAMKGS